MLKSSSLSSRERTRERKRDIVSLNCAAGLVITGLEPDLKAGLARANEAIDSGAALEVLRKWQNFG